jgi:prepilin-type N-terminal cleavage/methylation domain-containing protein
MRDKKRKGAGFTLVELLVVVAIIGLLASMLVLSIQRFKAKARDAQRLTDINNISTALALYHTDFNTYPVFNGEITGSDALSLALEAAGLISRMPLDPKNIDAAADCAPIGGYHYYYQSAGPDYILEYCLETNAMAEKNQGYNFSMP